MPHIKMLLVKSKPPFRIRLKKNIQLKTQRPTKVGALRQRSSSAVSQGSRSMLDFPEDGKESQNRNRSHDRKCSVSMKVKKLKRRELKY